MLGKTLLSAALLIGTASAYDAAGSSINQVNLCVYRLVDCSNSFKPVDQDDYTAVTSCKDAKAPEPSPWTNVKHYKMGEETVHEVEVGCIELSQASFSGEMRLDQGLHMVRVRAFGDADEGCSTAISKFYPPTLTCNNINCCTKYTDGGHELLNNGNGNLVQVTGGVSTVLLKLVRTYPGGESCCFDREVTDAKGAFPTFFLTSVAVTTIIDAGAKARIEMHHFNSDKDTVDDKIWFTSDDNPSKFQTKEKAEECSGDKHCGNFQIGVSDAKGGVQTLMLDERKRLYKKTCNGAGIGTNNGGECHFQHLISPESGHIRFTLNICKNCDRKEEESDKFTTFVAIRKDGYLDFKFFIDSGQTGWDAYFLDISLDHFSIDVKNPREANKPDKIKVDYTIRDQDAVDNEHSEGLVDSFTGSGTHAIRFLRSDCDSADPVWDTDKGHCNTCAVMYDKMDAAHPENAKIHIPEGVGKERGVQTIDCRSANCFPAYYDPEKDTGKPKNLPVYIPDESAAFFTVKPRVDLSRGYHFDTAYYKNVNYEWKIPGATSLDGGVCEGVMTSKDISGEDAVSGLKEVVCSVPRDEIPDLQLNLGGSYSYTTSYKYTNRDPYSYSYNYIYWYGVQLDATLISGQKIFEVDTTSGYSLRTPSSKKSLLRSVEVAGIKDESQKEPVYRLEWDSSHVAGYYKNKFVAYYMQFSIEHKETGKVLCKLDYYYDIYSGRAQLCDNIALTEEQWSQYKMVKKQRCYNSYTWGQYCMQGWWGSWYGNREYYENRLPKLSIGGQPISPKKDSPIRDHQGNKNCWYSWYNSAFYGTYPNCYYGYTSVKEDETQDLGFPGKSFDPDTQYFDMSKLSSFGGKTHMNKHGYKSYDAVCWRTLDETSYREGPTNAVEKVVSSYVSNTGSVSYDTRSFDFHVSAVSGDFKPRGFGDFKPSGEFALEHPTSVLPGVGNKEGVRLAVISGDTYAPAGFCRLADARILHGHTERLTAEAGEDSLQVKEMQAQKLTLETYIANNADLSSSIAFQGFNKKALEDRIKAIDDEIEKFQKQATKRLADWLLKVKKVQAVDTIDPSLNVKKFKLFWVSTGYYFSEISFSVKRGTESVCEFPKDDLSKCEQTLDEWKNSEISMRDSWGDGWNGYQLGLALASAENPAALTEGTGIGAIDMDSCSSRSSCEAPVASFDKEFKYWYHFTGLTGEKQDKNFYSRCSDFKEEATCNPNKDKKSLCEWRPVNTDKESYHCVDRCTTTTRKNACHELSFCRWGPLRDGVYVKNGKMLPVTQDTNEVTAPLDWNGEQAFYGINDYRVKAYADHVSPACEALDIELQKFEAAEKPEDIGNVDGSFTIKLDTSYEYSNNHARFGTTSCHMGLFARNAAMNGRKGGRCGAGICSQYSSSTACGSVTGCTWKDSVCVVTNECFQNEDMEPWAFTQFAFLFSDGMDANGIVGKPLNRVPMFRMSYWSKTTVLTGQASEFQISFYDQDAIEGEVEAATMIQLIPFVPSNVGATSSDLARTKTDEFGSSKGVDNEGRRNGAVLQGADTLCEFSDLKLKYGKKGSEKTLTLPAGQSYVSRKFESVYQYSSSYYEYAGLANHFIGVTGENTVRANCIQNKMVKGASTSLGSGMKDGDQCKLYGKLTCSGVTRNVDIEQRLVDISSRNDPLEALARPELHGDVRYTGLKVVERETRRLSQSRRLEASGTTVTTNTAVSAGAKAKPLDLNLDLRNGYLKAALGEGNTLAGAQQAIADATGDAAAVAVGGAVPTADDGAALGDLDDVATVGAAAGAAPATGGSAGQLQSNQRVVLMTNGGGVDLTAVSVIAGAAGATIIVLALILVVAARRRNDGARAQQSVVYPVMPTSQIHGARHIDPSSEGGFVADKVEKVARSM